VIRKSIAKNMDQLSSRNI